MKIEPFTEDEIKAELKYWTKVQPGDYDGETFKGPALRMIYTWAHAKAESERMKWAYDFTCGEYDFSKKTWTAPDWLAAVLKRIGWVE